MAKGAAEPFDIEVGTRIREARLNAAFSQAELASRLGVTFQQVHKYERGATRIAASTLVRIANALGVTPASLLGDSLKNPLIEQAAAIIAAYLAKNKVAPADVPGIIRSACKALSDSAPLLSRSEPRRATPAEIRQSIQTDYLVCFEDGLQMKSLKRHLWAKYGLTPQAYCERWGLPKNYPMVAPTYSEARSKLAKEHGLGRRKIAITPDLNSARRKLI